MQAKNAVVKRREELFRGRVFRLEREQVVLGNGAEAGFEIIRHPGAAAVLPLTADGGLLLLRQYRHAVGRFIWEVPAGTLNPGEDPQVCAARELTEETGFRARRLEKIGEIFPLPGYSDERIHLFVASGLVEERQNLDADEWLQVMPLPLDEVAAMIGDGRIADGKTICAVHLFCSRQALTAGAGGR